jgi:hypothetical protein
MTTATRVTQFYAYTKQDMVRLCRKDIIDHLLSYLCEHALSEPKRFAPHVCSYLAQVIIRESLSKDSRTIQIPMKCGEIHRDTRGVHIQDPNLY